MTATPTLIRVTSILASVFFLAAACGSSDSAINTDIATLQDDSEGGPAAIETAEDDDIEAPENPEDAFTLFEDCMSDAGFDFASGGAVIGGISIESAEGGQPDEADPQTPGGSIDDFDPGDFAAANDECGAHLANLDGGFDLTPEQEAAFDDAQLEWNKCMSDQGVDLPEFDGDLSGGSGITVIEIDASDVDPQDGLSADDLDFDVSAFEEAAEACEFVYDQFDELDGVFGEPDQ